MRFLVCLFLCSASCLFAHTAPFASQSDLTADLSDVILNGIYHHRLNQERCPSEKSVWLEGFGSYRERSSSHHRHTYDNGFGGFLVGFNYGLSCDAYLNFFVGSSWGSLDICKESDFDTHSVVFGATWERLCECNFYGFALVAGYLNEDRSYLDVHEEPRGVFLSPEFTYARQLNCYCLNPIFSGTIRYAGFFSRDYQHRELLGTLYVHDRTIQLITLRAELAFPYCICWGNLEPYIGIAGRFQPDGNHVEGKLLLDHEKFSDGIDNSLIYGLLGFRFTKKCGCNYDLQANVEGSYDSDLSWRILGELSLNYRY